MYGSSVWELLQSRKAPKLIHGYYFMELTGELIAAQNRETGRYQFR